MRAELFLAGDLHERVNGERREEEGEKREEGGGRREEGRPVGREVRVGDKPRRRDWLS